MVRLTDDPKTQAYAERRRAEGKTTREIVRWPQRYVAREVYRAPHRPACRSRRERSRQPASPPASASPPSRPFRRLAHQHLTPRRGLSRNGELASDYQAWLAEIALAIGKSIRTPAML